MSKSSLSKKLNSTPDREQIAGVRRLVDRGDMVLARKRLDVLRKSYPDFEPLLGMVWEIESRGGHPIQATVRAYEWHRALPNSSMALEALCESANLAGYTAILGCALRRLSVMKGQDDVQAPEMLDSPLGALTLEQGEAIDLSRMHLAVNNPAAAIAVLQDVNHPSARNNLAIALFITGDLAQARAVIEANWRAGPDNLFALESAVRWRCWAEGLDRCMGFSAPLQHTQPRRADDAIAQISALRFLGDEKAVQLAWKNSKNAPYWKDTEDEYRTKFASLKETGVELLGNINMWFPGPWIKKLSTFSSKDKADPRWDAHLEACDAHVDYLVRAVDFGDAITRLMALSVLKHRVKRSDPAAVASLTSLLTHSNGPDDARIELLNWLTTQGLRKRSEPAQIWISGESRSIRLYDLRITDEPRPSHFPPEGAAISDQIHEAIDHHQHKKALTLAQILLKMYPDDPQALVNLAGIKEGLRYKDAEVADIYRQAYALAPDYLFARCGLARCLARLGNLKEAHSLLDGLIEREEFHRSEYRSLLMSQRSLALASGEHEAVKNLDKSLDQLDKELPL